MNGTPPTAVISGASAGIGRATAQAFARAGYQLALIARSARGLAETQAELVATGARILAIPADVADAEAIEQAAARIEAELGPIDVWVNSAMVTVYAPVSQMTAAEVRRVTEVTYLGFVHGTMAALKYMKPRNRGVIVQVGSALSYRAIPLQSAYCAAKFAIRGFTDALRCELIRDQSRVRLTMVQLPAHNTPQFDWARNKTGRHSQPVPPIHTPEVAARAILRAAIDAPREFWLGRATIQAIIGSMLLPGRLDRMMAKGAYDGQMGDPENMSDRPDNLYQPVEGLHRSAGRFTAQARDKAFGLSSETAGLLLALSVAIVAILTILLTALIAD